MCVESTLVDKLKILKKKKSIKEDQLSLCLLALSGSQRKRYSMEQKNAGSILMRKNLKKLTLIQCVCFPENNEQCEDGSLEAFSFLSSVQQPKSQPKKWCSDRISGSVHSSP